MLCRPKTAWHREAVEQSFLDHSLRATVAFFCRLEDEIDGSVKLPMLG
jgi:hypothetical protein